MKNKLILILSILPSLCLASGWECINRNFHASCNTWRMAVPHGWLVSTDNDDAHIAMTYFQDEEHTWKI